MREEHVNINDNHVREMTGNEIWPFLQSPGCLPIFEDQFKTFFKTF